MIIVHYMTSIIYRLTIIKSLIKRYINRIITHYLGCDTIVLNSSGGAMEEQEERMGIYKMRNSKISGKIVYKHTKRKDYLYFVKGTSAKDGHWMVC